MNELLTNPQGMWEIGHPLRVRACAGLRPNRSILKLCAVLAGFLLLGSFACRKKNVEEDWAKTLPVRIQVGESQADAEIMLGQCGFRHSYDRRTNTVYGLKPGEQDWPKRQFWSAKVILDSKRRVAKVMVKVISGDT